MPRLSSSFKKALKGVVNFLFPPFCPGCGNYLGFRSDARRLCGLCLKALRGSIREYSHWMQAPRGLDGLWSLGPYGSEPLTALIHKMKYQSKDWILEGLRPALKEFLPASGLEHMTDLIVPVPLHAARLRERGFNQAGRIAQELKMIFKLDLSEDAILKTKKTGPQARLEGHSKRVKNISGSFEASGVEGRKILLVDDVYTSGATLAECAKALRQAGAIKVFGFTLARAKV